MKKYLFLIIKIAVTIFAFAFLFYSTDLTRIIESISQLNVGFLLIGIISHFVYLFVGSINLIPVIPHKIKSKKTRLELYTKSWAWGMFVPGKLGDFSLIYYLKQNQVSLPKGFAAALLIKISAISILILFGGISYFFILNFKTPLILITTILIIIIIHILFISRGTYKILSYFFRKKDREIKEVRKEIVNFYSKPKKVLILYCVTAIRWIVDGFTNFLVILALGITPTFIVIIGANALAAILSMIPVSISGLGIREGSKTYLYALGGVPLNIGAASAVIYIILLYIFAGTTLIFWRDKK